MKEWTPREKHTNIPTYVVILECVLSLRPQMPAMSNAGANLTFEGKKYVCFLSQVVFGVSFELRWRSRSEIHLWRSLKPENAERRPWNINETLEMPRAMHCRRWAGEGALDFLIACICWNDIVSSWFLEIGQKGSKRPLGILSGVDLSEHNCNRQRFTKWASGKSFSKATQPGRYEWVRMGWGFDVEKKNQLFFWDLFDIARPYRQIPGIEMLDRYRYPWSIQHVTCDFRRAHCLREFQGLEDQWSQDPCPWSFETYGFR